MTWEDNIIVTLKNHFRKVAKIIQSWFFLNMCLAKSCHLLASIFPFLLC